jgi:fido (protein-threonine AMPylation protein)
MAEVLEKTNVAIAVEKDTAPRSDQKAGTRDEASLRTLQNLHFEHFGSVMQDAGQLRTVGLVKGTPGERVVFVDPQNLANYAKPIFDRVNQELPSVANDKSLWPSFAAQTYAELNALHPFRDGNDRVAREFLVNEGKKLGLSVNFDTVGVTKWDQASIESFKGNTSLVQEVFAQITSPVRERSEAIAQKTDRPELAASNEPKLTERFAIASSPDQLLGDSGAKIPSGSSLSLVSPDKISARLSGQVIADNPSSYIIKTTPQEAVVIDKSSNPNLWLENGETVRLSREGEHIMLQKFHQEPIVVRDQEREPSVRHRVEIGER